MFQTLDGKFLTAAVCSCWQKGWFLNSTGTKFQGFFIFDFRDFFYSTESKKKCLVKKRTIMRHVANAPLKCLCPLAYWKHSQRSCSSPYWESACIFVLLFRSLMKLITCSRRLYDKYCMVPEDWNSKFFPFFVRSFLFILSNYPRI